MDVLEAVASRYSCRAFLPTPVPEKIVREIVERAARAPSAGNMQPWRIYAVAGQRVEELKALLAPRMATELPKGEGTDYTIYPEPLDRTLSGTSLYCRRIALSVDQTCREMTRRRATNNILATISFSVRRSHCSSPVKKFTGPRNGPISAVTFRPLLCWHADSGCIPVRSRRGFHFTAQCVLFCGCPTI